MAAIGGGANGVAANGAPKGPAVPNPLSPASEQAREKLWAECLALEQKVQAFLGEEALSPRLQGVQRQTRLAMDVIKQALETYSCV